MEVSCHFNRVTEPAPQAMIPNNWDGWGWLQARTFNPILAANTRRTIQTSDQGPCHVQLQVGLGTYSTCTLTAGLGKAHIVRGWLSDGQLPSPTFALFWLCLLGVPRHAGVSRHSLSHSCWSVLFSQYYINGVEKICTRPIIYIIYI